MRSNGATRGTRTRKSPRGRRHYGVHSPTVARHYAGVANNATDDHDGPGSAHVVADVGTAWRGRVNCDESPPTKGSPEAPDVVQPLGRYRVGGLSEWAPWLNGDTPLGARFDCPWIPGPWADWFSSTCRIRRWGGRSAAYRCIPRRAWLEPEAAVLRDGRGSGCRVLSGRSPALPGDRSFPRR